MFLFRYLNDLDYDLHYGGLGVTPLPLHGQVRPIKVEQDTWNSMDSNDEHSSHNISSTPPILRRRARKREADDHEVVFFKVNSAFLFSFLNMNYPSLKFSEIHPTYHLCSDGRTLSWIFKIFIFKIGFLHKYKLGNYIYLILKKLCTLYSVHIPGLPGLIFWKFTINPGQISSVFTLQGRRSRVCCK